MKRYILFSALSVVLPALGTPAKAEFDGPLYYGMQVEEFEVRQGDEKEKLFTWNADAFVGNDDIKLRWQGEGEYDRKAHIFEGMENTFVAQVPVSTFFDAKAGVRFDTPKGPDRWYGVVGVSGLAPQWIEVDADLFLSEKGDVSARLDVEYELLITNRLILTPSADLNASFSDDTEIKTKSGLTSAELGLRLSYDLVDRLVSPYVGVAYERKFGNTADLIAADGEDTEGWFTTMGLKMVF